MLRLCEIFRLEPIAGASDELTGCSHCLLGLRSSVLLCGCELPVGRLGLEFEKPILQRSLLLGLLELERIPQLLDLESPRLPPVSYTHLTLPTILLV